MYRLLRSLLPGLPRRLAALGTWQLIAAVAETALIALTVHLMASLGARNPVTSGSSSAWLNSLSFGAATAVAFGAILLRAAAQACGVYLWARGVESYERLHRGRLLHGLLQAQWSVQSREPAGRLQHLLTHHAECLSKAYTAVAWSCIHVVTATLLFTAAIVAQPAIALVGLVCLAACFAFLRPLSRRCREAASRRAGALGHYVHLIGQVAGLLRELRVFGASPAFERRAEESAEVIGTMRRTQNALGSLIPALHQCGAALLLLGGLWWAHAYSGTESVVVSLVLLLRAASTAQHLGATYHQLQDARPFLQEVMAALEIYDGAAEAGGGLAPGQIETLELRHVGYCYGDERGRALADACLSARRGEVVAIVGPSGSGKTTLAHLALRLLAPSQGSVSINGRAAELFALDAWFRRVAFLPQEPALFHDTIRECVRFGRADVTDDDVRRALVVAGLEDDVAAMPKGFDTLVGERGSELSFGQRQRVCLARALAGRPDVVVFDEPTAALDADAEERIVSSIEQLRGRVLVLVVTHRPALLRACDRIVEIDRGRTFIRDAKARLSAVAA